MRRVFIFIQFKLKLFLISPVFVKKKSFSCNYSVRKKYFENTFTYLDDLKKYMF
jgi:hypothetical protein